LREEWHWKKAILSIIAIENNDLEKAMRAMWFGERAIVDRRKLVDRISTTP